MGSVRETCRKISVDVSDFLASITTCVEMINKTFNLIASKCAAIGNKTSACRNAITCNRIPNSIYYYGLKIALSKSFCNRRTVCIEKIFLFSIKRKQHPTVTSADESLSYHHRRKQ